MGYLRTPSASQMASFYQYVWRQDLRERGYSIRLTYPATGLRHLERDVVLAENPAMTAELYEEWLGMKWENRD